MQINVAMGRLTNNPELRTTVNGKPVALFSIAINNSKDDTTFLEMIAYNTLAENINKYCEKGNRIIVEYIIKNNNYEKDGKKIRKLNFIVTNARFIDFKAKEAEPTSMNFDDIVIPDDMLPFDNE